MGVSEQSLPGLMVGSGLTPCVSKLWSKTGPGTVLLWTIWNSTMQHGSKGMREERMVRALQAYINLDSICVQSFGLSILFFSFLFIEK